MESMNPEENIEQFRDALEMQGIEINPKYAEQIQLEFAEAINTGRPLSYVHTNNHLGDHFIIRSAMEIVFEKFTQKHNLPPAKISLAKQPSSSAVNISKTIATWSYGIEPYRYASNNMYLSYMFWLADHLGVELAPEDYNRPPRPYKCDFEGSPMKNFDWNEVMKYKAELEATMDPDFNYCVVLHGGSKPCKRFSRNQTREVRTTLKTLFPNNKYAILTAQSIDGNGGEELTDEDADVVVEATENINKTAALFLAPRNITYVGSDTFLKWLGAGMIAMREDRKDVGLRPRDVYVLNTVASSYFWKIPGANHFESLAIKHLRSTKGRLRKSSDHLISDADYYGSEVYTSYKDKTPEYIAQEDLSGFMRFIYDHNTQD